MTSHRARRLLIGGVVVLILGLLYAWGSTWFELIDKRAMLRHNGALSALLLDLAKDSCTGPDALEQAARKLGWETDRLLAPYDSSLYDDALPVALNIYVSPPIPLNKIDFRIFQFDDRGCLALLF